MLRKRFGLVLLLTLAVTTVTLTASSTNSNSHSNSNDDEAATQEQEQECPASSLPDSQAENTTTTCTSSDNPPNKAQQSPQLPDLQQILQDVGSLRPFHLPAPVVFSNFTLNTTVTLDENGRELHVADGKVTQINPRETTTTTAAATAAATTAATATEFSVITRALSQASVEHLLQLLRSYQYWDEDPDTVDGMPTYELFVETPDLYTQPGAKIRDYDPQFVPYRRELRRQLQAVLQPYLDQVLTPYVQQRYPHACHKYKSPTRRCTPCYSLIRKYHPHHRMSHATHYDGHAIVTVVVSLSDYGRDYQGGLYVATAHGQHEFVALHKGDAVVHQSTLLHGVKVYDTKNASMNTTTNTNNNTVPETNRWSWILWYRDATDCSDYSYEWFQECAAPPHNHPLCQQLHATKVPTVPGISQELAHEQVLEWNLRAAHGGAGMAAVKIARAYLHQLPSSLPLDVAKAAHYYQLAIASQNNPDGHYGMAQLFLQQVTIEQQQQQQQSTASTKQDDYYKDPRVMQAVHHLEAAAVLDHAYSQFNLGMVHTYGYATGIVNGTIAAQWFETSGLPEGYYLAAQQAKAIGNVERYQHCADKAVALGFTAPWRQQARLVTGSGGASGVSLNLPWPMAMDGRRPPQL